MMPGSRRETPGGRSALTLTSFEVSAGGAFSRGWLWTFSSWAEAYPANASSRTTAASGRNPAAAKKRNRAGERNEPYPRPSKRAIWNLILWLPMLSQVPPEFNHQKYNPPVACLLLV